MTANGMGAPAPSQPLAIRHSRWLIGDPVPPVAREENVAERGPLDDWMREIQKVARKASVDWPGIVEADHLVQEVCIHILERPGTQLDLAEMGPGERYRTLHKIAQRIASQERDEYDVFSGNFRYSVGEVEKILRQGEAAFRPVGVESSWSVGDVVSAGGDVSDPTARSALDSIEKQSLRRDLGTALSKLNPAYVDILIRRFVHEETGMEAKERKRLERALAELTHEMNHSYKQQHVGDPTPGKSLGDGPGTRRAISHSAARYLSKDGYDSDYYPAPSHMRDNHIEQEVWE